LLTGDRSSNLYTISLNEVASNSSTCLVAKAYSLQSWLCHQRLSHLNFATINNLVKNNLVQGLPKMKFEKIICVQCVNKGRFIGNITSPKRLLLQTSLFIFFTWICMIIIDLEDEVVNLLEKEKVNLETIESLKLKSFESSEKVCSESENQSDNDRLVVEKECDKEENPKVIAPGIFKLNVSQCVSPISMSKSSCDYKNVEIKLKRKRLKRKSSKQNVKQVDNDVSRANKSCYLLNDYEDVEKLKAKGDIGVFVGYSKESAAFRIYNKRTRKIHESMNANFDKISEMASKQFSLEPRLSKLNETRKSSNRSVSKVDEASKNDLEYLFQDLYDEYFDS
nr:ribonuclease H-like domain-containing protein [Tanacetum cinerariifolium]